ncbi:MAG: nickel pincer cofactor biosynthesis protein LarC [Deltaproteobacteria bacterium]|nr:nickel pincer cofactor biosynthesis protein LarC [Deltaproteobacteria bacterium]
MTRWLHLDPVGGIAGDMTLAALIDLGASLERIREGLEALGLEPFEIVTARAEVGALVGTSLEVVVEGHPPSRDWRDIRPLLQGAALPERARRRALAAFEALAVAEGKAHGVPPETVHFHEVGAVDALVDIVGCALALEELGVEKVSASPPPLGRGVTDSSHGPIPIPVPAVLRLLEGLPVVGTEVEGERVTPTGAALLASLCEGRVGAMPALRIEATGHGAGRARFSDRPNIVRAILGEVEEASVGAGEVWVQETNLDDLSPELIAACAEAVFGAGALDVWVTPVGMKKGRPGHLITALSREEERAAVAEALLRHSSSFGLRAHRAQRLELERDFVRVVTRFGEVQVKVGRLRGEVTSRTPELEDCARLAREAGVPVREVYTAALAAADALAAAGG